MKPNLIVKPFLKPNNKPKRLPERKAVTIGMGFHCSDGIVLCSDTQITWQGFHKDYEHKIVHFGTEGKWTLACTYSGSPALAKMFYGKFQEARNKVESKGTPLDATTLQNLIETVLSFLEVLDNDPNSLSLLCAIVVDNQEMRLVHTEGKIVSVVKRPHFIGCGDSSVIRYLVPIIATQYSGDCMLTTRRAIHIGTYLTLQAKKYVDGCGGDTDILTVSRNGSIHLSYVPLIEKDVEGLEFLMERAATELFDLTMPDEKFKVALDEFVRTIEKEREDMKTFAQKLLPTISPKREGQQ